MSPQHGIHVQSVGTPGGLILCPQKPSLISAVQHTFKLCLTWKIKGALTLSSILKAEEGVLQSCAVGGAPLVCHVMLFSPHLFVYSAVIWVIGVAT